MVTNLEQIEKGRLYIERIINRIARDKRIVMQNPDWEDNKKNRSDRITNYRFCFEFKDNKECIGFSGFELMDCSANQNTVWQIENKIRWKFKELQDKIKN